VSYADTIVQLATDRGKLALSAYKIKSVREAGKETEITYVTGDSDTAWPQRAKVFQPFQEVYDMWIRALRAWDGA
jgi:hypothetical protein